MPATVPAAAPLQLDPQTDDLRSVAALMADLTGRRPSPPTVWRWCVRGTRRAGKLPALRVYGSWSTTRKALVEWLQRESERPAADAAAKRDPATERRLRAAGLLSD